MVLFSFVCTFSSARRNWPAQSSAPSLPKKKERGDARYLQLFLVLARRVEHFLHVLREAELAQSLVDVIRGDGLLGLLLRYLVRLGGDEGHELDAAVDEQVARILAERQPGLVAEDLGDDFLDCR